MMASTGEPMATMLVGVPAGTTTSRPLIGSDRGALVALVAVEVTMSALRGIGVAPTPLGWTHPVTIMRIALGTLIGFTVVLPLVACPAAVPAGGLGAGRDAPPLRSPDRRPGRPGGWLTT
jgi:hypothetical protein